MRILILMTSYMLLMPTVFGKGGDTVSNGGGLGEQNVTYAWFKFPELLKLCEASVSCAGNPTDFKFLKTQFETWKDAKKRFLLGTEDPTLFPEEQALLFKQDLNGDRYIYINLERLYTGDPNVSSAIGVEKAIESIIDALVENEELAKKYAPSLSRLFSSRKASIDLSVGSHPEFRLMFFEAFGSELEVSLDNDGVIEVVRFTSDICSLWSQGSKKADTLNKPSVISSLRWVGDLGLNPAKPVSMFRVRGDFNSTCSDIEGNKFVLAGSFYFSFKLKKNSKKVHYIRGSHRWDFHDLRVLE